MPADRRRRWGWAIGIIGGAAISAALLGVGTAYGDDNTVDINGWTVQLGPETSTGNGDSATLLDPAQPLGSGTEISGVWQSTPVSAPLGPAGLAAQLGLGGPEADWGVDNSFVDSSGGVAISNFWYEGFETAEVSTSNGDAAQAILVPSLDGKDVVDLYNFDTISLAGDEPGDAHRFPTRTRPGPSTWAASIWHRHKTVDYSTISTTRYPTAT